MMETTSVLTILRRRSFALLWFGQLISNVGNWVFWIALPFYVYERTGSTLATGMMLIFFVQCFRVDSAVPARTPGGDNTDPLGFG